MILFMLGVLTAAAGPVTPLTADQAVSQAQTRSATIARSMSNIGRTEGVVSAECGLRNDPTLRGSTAVVGEAWSLSLVQPISLTGEGRAACSGARRTHEAAVATAQRVQLEVAAETRRAWVGAVVARQQRQIAERALAAAQEIEASARKRQAVGEASQLDLRLARLQVERVRTAWMFATVEEGRQLADLSGQVGVEVEGLTLPKDPLSGVVVPVEGDGGRRADGVAAVATASAAAAAVRRERVGTLPAVGLGVFVGEDGDELRAGPSLSVTLPVWRGNTDGRADAHAALVEADAERDATERRVAAERATSGRATRVLEAALADQGGDIPAEAQAALASVVLGYGRGELDLLSTSQLQAEILAGHSAWLRGREVVAYARLDRLLAQGDRRLLGEEGGVELKVR